MKAIGLLAVAFFVLLRVNGEEEEEDEGEYVTSAPPAPPPPFKPIIELAKDLGYDMEKFDIKSNGYIITIFHVKPKKNGGPVVLLQHGLMATSDIWLLKNNSLACALTDGGNDVWLSNIRGNYYGRKHENLNADTDEKFWDFSWDEIAAYDLPRIIDFVLEKTKKSKLHYIGHSLGTTLYLVLLAQKPEYNDKIKEATLLSPVYFCGKYKNFIEKGSSINNMIEESFKKFNDKHKWESFPRVDVPKNDHQLQCSDLPEIGVSFCEMGLQIAKGAIGDYFPAGATTKISYHYAQAFSNGVVQPYDFGEEENMKKYKQKAPPYYNLKNIRTKTNLFYSIADEVTDEKDANQLKNELPSVGMLYEIKVETFGHGDYLTPVSSDNNEPFDDMVNNIVKLVV